MNHLISDAWEYWIGDPEITELLKELARARHAYDRGDFEFVDYVRRQDT